LGVLCWLFEDAIVERLAEQINPSPNALTEAQRAERLAQLDAESLELQRLEEVLLSPTDMRRQNADARAVLGLL
jgi:hypothetical protein